MTNHARLFALLVAVSAATGCAGSSGDAEASLTAAQCNAATPWAAGVAYATGAVVTFDGATFQCIQGHTSQADWTPSVVPALWGTTDCASGGTGSGGTGSGGTGSGGGSTGGTCDANAWIYMADNANACDGKIGESCGWTTANLGQGYHCAATSWGTGCEPGGTTCPGGGATPPPTDPTDPTDPPTQPPGGGTGNAPASLIFSAYKDTSINMNWNTNVITTMVSGSATALTTDLLANGSKTITLAFATGECGSENWGGVPGAAMAAANAAQLNAAGIKYILSTGGAAGVFTCASDAGFETFISRWATPGLIGIDFDIEGGQSAQILGDLIRRVQGAHNTHPGLRFSLTLATLANNNGATTAQSLGAGIASGLNSLGETTLAAVRSTLGFTGSPSTWPSYVTVNLMTMDFGATSSGNCVVNAGVCDMGQSALQAAFNLRDKSGVPFKNIELTPMIGGNDTQAEHVTLQNVDTMTAFAIANNMAGVHYWSYDRDTDCPPGSASPTCNSLGGVGAHGFLRRFLAGGLH